MDLNKAPPSRVLFVKDIPQRVSYDSFENLFKSLPGYLMMRRKPHFAFVEFKDREFATMAMIKFTGYKFDSSDKPLIIDYDKDRNKDIYDDHRVRDNRDSYSYSGSSNSSSSSYHHNDSYNSSSSSSSGSSRHHHSHSNGGDRVRDRGYSKDYSSSSSNNRRKEMDDEDDLKSIDYKDRTSKSSSSSSPPYSSSSSSPLSSSPLPSHYYQDRKRIRSEDYYPRSSSSSSSSSLYSSSDRYHDSYRSTSSSSPSSYLIPTSSMPLSSSNYHLPPSSTSLSSSHYHGGSALPPQSSITTTGMPCSTLFVSNLPKDVTERELSILFRFMRGFVGIRLINKEGKLPMCFCDFIDTQSSMFALEFLQGFRMDASDISSSISIEFDKANHKSR
ncbi:hypothetical protein ACTFIW_010250 [Dictyostelium discoideum]